MTDESSSTQGLIQGLVDQVVAVCPFLGDDASEIVAAVVRNAGRDLDRLEDLLSGGRDGGRGMAVALMTVGAVSYLLERAFVSNHRLQLFRAGRVVGRYLLERFSERIAGAIRGN